MTAAVPFAVSAVALGVAAFGIRRRPSAALVRVAVVRPTTSPRRRRDVRTNAGADLPLFLDLLAAATSAGMSGPVAFAAAATALRGGLGDRLRAVAAATDLGIPLGEALREASSDLALPDLARAATILERSGSLGVPMSVALRDLASEHRRDRRRAAEQRARTAPVRMLFPLVFLVLPAFLLLTVVPMLLVTIGSLS